MKRVVSFVVLLIVLSCEELPQPSFSLISFNPPEGYVGQQVIITGTNFSATASENVVAFGDVVAPVTNASTTSLTVTVPANADTDFITVTLNGETLVFGNEFTVLKGEVTDISPKSGRIGSYVVLSGNGFDENTTVMFDGIEAKVISYGANTLVVAVPKITELEVEVTVSFNGVDVPVLETFAIAHDTWVSRGELPGVAHRGEPIWFSIGTKIYYGLGGDYSGGSSDVEFLFDLWEYSTETNQWTAKKDFPIEAGGMLNTLGQQHAFVIDGMAYVMNGNSMWQYDPGNDEWTRLESPFPPVGAYRRSGVTFVINDKGYFGTGTDGVNMFKDFWEYDAASGEWTKKPDFTGTARYYAMGFAVGGKGYLGGGAAPGSNDKGDFYEYDPATNAWTKKPDSPVAQTFGLRGAFGSESFGYCGDQTGAFYKYDPARSLWVEMETLPGQGDLWALTANGKGYVNNGAELWEMNID